MPLMYIEKELSRTYAEIKMKCIHNINMSLTMMGRSCFCSHLCYYLKNGELLSSQHSEEREDICPQWFMSLVKPFK